jgi:hypothetical protein
MKSTFFQLMNNLSNLYRSQQDDRVRFFLHLGAFSTLGLLFHKKVIILCKMNENGLGYILGDFRKILGDFVTKTGHMSIKKVRKTHPALHEMIAKIYYLLSGKEVIFSKWSKQRL